MRLLFIILISGLLLACTESFFGKPLLTECKSGAYVVNIEFMKQPELKKLYLRSGQSLDAVRGRPDRILGFTGIYRGHNYMFVSRPRGQSDSETIETIGHELLHIACGSWHPN